MLLTTKYYQQKLNKLDHISIRKDCFSFIKHPENFHKELLNLIKAAQKRIYITALYLQDDECGREVLKAIFERAKECPSLNVFILVDFHRAQRGLMGKGKQVGNTLMYEELYNQYKITNIHILGVPVKTKELFGVLHLKGFVFDNTVLYSGASINNIYLGYDNKYRLDRYHKIVSEELSNSFVDFLQSNIIQNPAVCTLTNTEQLPSVKSIVDKIAKFKHRLKKSSYKFENGVNSNDCVYATPMVGLGNTHNLLNSVILKLLKTVEKEIVICTPYFNPPRQLSKSIVSLLKKGIKVTLVVGDKIANDFYIPSDQPFNRVGAVPYLYEDFLRNFCYQNQNFISNGLLNVMLWKDGTNTYHVKGIFVDHNRYLLTGNNLNPRAWRMDIENGILIQDPNQLLRNEFEAEREFLLQHTKRIERYTDIENVESIPECYKAYLKKFYRFKLHLLIKNII